jgi:pilus assembly protein CpaE
LTELLAREAPSMRVVESREYPALDASPPLAGGALPRVCFLDACSNQEQALGLLGRLPMPPLRIPVVVLLSEGDHELALRCLRVGACGCLVRPFDSEQLQPVLLRVGCMVPGSGLGDSGRVLGVVPAKGSCGATTLAANLACRLRRAGSKRVLLADMDSVAGTLAFVLKLRSNYSFVDALAHADRLDAELWKGLVIPYRELDVLLSPENPLDHKVETSGTSSLLAYARRAYDLAVLDAGSPYGAMGLELVRLSDEVLLVTTTELGAVYGAKRALAHLRGNGVAKSKIRLVVSRWRGDVGFEREEIEAALDLAVFHVLPSDPQAIDAALIEGRPVASGSPFGKSLAELAARLWDRDVPPAKPSPRKGLRLLFSRRP